MTSVPLLSETGAALVGAIAGGLGVGWFVLVWLYIGWRPVAMARTVSLEGSDLGLAVLTLVGVIGGVVLAYMVAPLAVSDDARLPRASPDRAVAAHTLAGVDFGCVSWLGFVVILYPLWTNFIPGTVETIPYLNWGLLVGFIAYGGLLGVIFGLVYRE